MEDNQEIMNPDLAVMRKKLKVQAEAARFYRRYYEGDQPLIYSHERLKDVFRKSNVKFIQNWCAVVIDTVLDRIELKGFDNPDEAVNKTLDEFWSENYLTQLSYNVHKEALITGNSFVLFDLQDDRKTAYFNDAETVAVAYEPDNPNKMRVGIKSYYDEVADIIVAILYYPDRIEKYEAKGKQTKTFTLTEPPIQNPFDGIPIVHYQCERQLSDVIPLQDAINKTLSDMMVVGEFGAFPQRWMITNADIDNLTSSPQAIMQIPKGTTDEEGTQIGEFGVANLSMYLDTIDKLTTAISVISRIPKHYYMATGANISGEALEIMEAPLVKKVKHIISGFEQSWIELAFEIINAEETVCVWERPETEQILGQIQAMKTMVEIGVPLITVLKRFGWSIDDISQMEQDLLEQKKRDASIMDAQIMAAMARMQQNPNPLNIAGLNLSDSERGTAE